MKNLRHCFTVFIITLFVVCKVTAGSAQSEGELFFEPETIMRFAKKVENTLSENGARVAILARVGRPRASLPDGISFTHAGFAVYSQIRTDDGRTILGYAVHNLYQRSDQKNLSNLMQDYPVDFFAGAQVLEAGIIIPTLEVQKRILKVLVSPVYEQLHNPKYSAIANPYTTDRQNCTEHVLDVIFSAIYKTEDILKIKASQKVYFKAQVVHENPLKVLLGSVFMPDVTIADHPGALQTATFTTIGDFLEAYHLVARRYIVTPDETI